MLNLLLKAKTLFLRWKVKIAIGLALLATLLALLVGSYQLGKRDAEVHCRETQLETELLEESRKTEFLIDLQKENQKFYRDQASFNQILSNKLEVKTVDTVREINTIYRDTPVEVINPCGNARIGYGFVRMRNDAGQVHSNTNQ